VFKDLSSLVNVSILLSCISASRCKILGATDDAISEGFIIYYAATWKIRNRFPWIVSSSFFVGTFLDLFAHANDILNAEKMESKQNSMS